VFADSSTLSRPMAYNLNERQMRRRIAQFGGQEVAHSEKERARELAYAAR
jgi:hypothetical protein